MKTVELFFVNLVSAAIIKLIETYQQVCDKIIDTGNKFFNM